MLGEGGMGPKDRPRGVLGPSRARSQLLKLWRKYLAAWTLHLSATDPINWERQAAQDHIVTASSASASFSSSTALWRPQGSRSRSRPPSGRQRVRRFSASCSAFSSGGKIVERKDDGGKRREDADLEAILTSGRRTMQKIPLSSRHSGDRILA